MDIDKLHKIKDLLNRILVEVYGLSDRGLITGIQKHNIGEPLPSGISEDSILILYENPKAFSIVHWPISNPETLREVLKKILKVTRLPDSRYKLDDIYKVVEPLFEYSNEELKLYFKLS